MEHIVRFLSLVHLPVIHVWLVVGTKLLTVQVVSFRLVVSRRESLVQHVGLG